MRRDVIMKLKKLLCTAFLALSCCATSAAAFTPEDVRFAKRAALLMASAHGVPNDGTLAAQRLYYIDMHGHLVGMLHLNFAAHIGNQFFANYIRSIPVLERHYHAGNLNAENFQTVVLDAIRLFDHLISQSLTQNLAQN